MITHMQSLKYAKALFMIGGSNEEIQRREEELKQVGNAIYNHITLLGLMTYPQLTVEKKLEFLEIALNKNLDPYVRRLIGIMIKKHHVRAIKQTALEYYKLVINNLKEIIVEVTSSEKFTESEKHLLKSQLDKHLGQKSNFIEKIDPSLLGGFTVLFEDRFLDLSIKGMISQLKNQLSKAKL